ncbi:hypothetical protein [Pararobbsia alpina]|uniref:Uncharacterized protein n=1 Tax=Pararobbsia alpina TaxID=621374 RepID=A0A6S7BCY9_9BURK|nr:hypothetical protein [Pararobbsia alpina]CAB3784593.1 hypothetical protein LMG28138_01840 [Pararobbsia alpina]
MSEVTEWFAAMTDPVHEGWYEVRYSWEEPECTHLCRYYWNGNGWSFGELGIEGGLAWGDKSDRYITSEFWRGLRSPA